MLHVSRLLDCDLYEYFNEHTETYPKYLATLWSVVFNLRKY